MYYWVSVDINEFYVYFWLAVLSAPSGVHAVLKTGNWVRYCIFDLATGKAEQENNFPTSNLAFLGQSERNVAIFTAGQVSTTLLNTTFSNIVMYCEKVVWAIAYPTISPFSKHILILFPGLSSHPSGWKRHNLPNGQRLYGRDPRPWVVGPAAHREPGHGGALPGQPPHQLNHQEESCYYHIGCGS